MDMGSDGAAKPASLTTRWRLTPARGPVLLAASLVFVGSGWALIWGPEWRWNPLAFSLMWTGAAVGMWSLSEEGYPGIRRHAELAAVSTPVWWWFEFVNGSVHNWEYVHPFEYGAVEFNILASVAFATVIPAVVAAAAMLSRYLGVKGARTRPVAVSRRFAYQEIAAGALCQLGVFLFPAQFYPLVWVAPFLAVDGAIVLAGGAGIVAGLTKGRWQDAAIIGMAGLVCGLFWEFWNYAATPKWVYHIPVLGFGKVFEMPVLGYGGYIPFAWSIVQLARLLKITWERASERMPGLIRQNV